MLRLSILLILNIHFCLPQTRYSPRILETAYGKVRGIIINSNLHQIEAYLGIPYASSPAASLRFMPPLTPSHWEGVRTADSFGPVCPQLLPEISNRTNALKKMPLLKYNKFLKISRLLANQSEDCLHLNIYRPEGDKKNLPIVIILQGDSWEWGSGNLVDGSALAANQLLVITLNFRLGALGFLQTSNQQGNFAIMDVVAALNWISQNGHAFGGDVTRITLLGHKTGAVLANFLMLAPVATELFHRVILLSGSATSPTSFQRHSKTNVRKLAQFFKCIEPSYPLPILKDIREFGPCLREVPLENLQEAVKNLANPRFIPRFAPLIDGQVIKQDFVNELKSVKKVKLLLGTASVESFSELNTEDIEDGLQELKRDRILRTLVRNVFFYHLNEIFSTIKNEYTDWEKPRKDFMDVRDSILNILSDGLTVAPMLQIAAMHEEKTFFFHFQYEPDGSVYPQRIGSITSDLLEFSVGHPLLKGNEDLPSYSPQDTKISSTLLHYLTNFIATGDPNTDNSEEPQLTYWDAYDPTNQLYLEIGPGDPRMRSHYRGHKMALWLNLIPQLHQSTPDVSMLHHNFKEEKSDYYEGPVRDQLKTIIDPPLPSPRFKLFPKEPKPTEEDDYEDKNPTITPNTLSSSECPPNTTNGGTIGPIFKMNVSEGDLVRQLAASHYHSYGTALGVTIGVGCCLLLLNLLIFLAIYHQKTNSPPLPPKKEEPCCRHHPNGPRFQYEEDYEEDILHSQKIFQKDISSSSGFSSPPIPDPPPPPRSIPPSLGGSLASLTSSRVLETNRKQDDYDYDYGMTKRVQEISV